MSSWNKPDGLLKLLPNDAFYCRTSTSGYCSNFFNFFMCYLYARSKNKVLYLHDTKNNISKEYHLILDTFQTPPGVQYTIKNGMTLHQTNNKEMRDYFDALSYDILSAEAKKVFRFTDSIQKRIDELKGSLPQIDCAIHVRTGDKITTGEMVAIPLERYKEALVSYQATLNKPTLCFYLMTDSKSVIQWFQLQKESSWSIFTIPSPSQFEFGHSQELYNKQSPLLISKLFVHFLAEVQVLSNAPHVICTFSSNIGRFVNLLRKGTITSLD
jgi:hypothetical protein